MTTSSPKPKLTWRGWIVPAGALLLGVIGILLARTIAPGLSLVAPRFDGPADGVLWTDRLGGPRPLTVGAPFVSGALLEVGSAPARFLIDRNGSVEAAPGSKLRFLNGAQSTTLELQAGSTLVELHPETAPTIVTTQVGSLHASEARFTLLAGSLADSSLLETLESLAPDSDWPELLELAERELTWVTLEQGAIEFRPLRGPALEVGKQELEAPARFLLAPGLPLTVVK